MTTYHIGEQYETQTAVPDSLTAYGNRVNVSGTTTRLLGSNRTVSSQAGHVQASGGLVVPVVSSAGNVLVRPV